MFKKKKKGGPKVVLKVSNTRKIYLPFYIMVICLTFLIGYMNYNGFYLTRTVIIFIVVFFAFVIKSTEIHRFRTEYEINENALVHREGIVKRRIRSIDYFAISDADVTQNFWQILFGYGDVNIRLFSKDSTMVVKNINDPRAFEMCLEETIMRKRGLK